MTPSFTYADIAGMRRITMRDLIRRTADTLDDVEVAGPTLVTRNGRPLAVLAPISDPELRRKRAREVVPAAERMGLPWSGPGAAADSAGGTPPVVEDPLPDTTLQDMERTLLAEIAWWSGRKWRVGFRNVGPHNMMDVLVAVTNLERLGFVQAETHGQRAHVTRLGARFAAERLGAEFVERAGRASYYGQSPEEIERK